MNDALTEDALRRLVAETEARHAALTEPKTIHLHGLALRIDPGVFDPSLSNIGDLLARVVTTQRHPSVLDVGTGSGFQALLAARQGAQVVALEKQSEGVACAAANVLLNGLAGRVEVRHSDLFSALGTEERFDCVLFNFPFVPWKAETAWQRANFDEGHTLLRRFFAEVGTKLKPRGQVCITWADLGYSELFLELCSAHGFSREELARREAHGVAHYVYGLRRV